MVFLLQGSIVLWVQGVVNDELDLNEIRRHYFQHLIDYALGQEKKEVAAKSLEALEKMGHKDLKLNEHESPSHLCDKTHVGDTRIFIHRLRSCHRVRDHTSG